jgi:hypothetical protein
MHRPLDWKQFDLMKEWYFEVPLEFQIVLSNLFLNKDSLRRLDDSDNYLYNRFQTASNLMVYADVQKLHFLVYDDFIC